MRRLLQRLGVAPLVASDMESALAARYAEPHRRYHTAEHINYVMAEAERLLPSAPDADADAVRLAVWFHDAVYDPTAPAGANEDASADLAAGMLSGAGVRTSLAEETARLIRLSADHQVLPGDDSGDVLVDADLSILAAPADRYDRYTRDVRAEYRHLDDGAWCRGRVAVLTRLLAGPPLFRVGRDQAARDTQARANMAREIDALGGAGSASG